MRDAVMERTRGAALLLCLVFIAASISLVVVLSTRSAAHLRQAVYASSGVSAFSAAETGLALAVADLDAGGTGCLGGAGPPRWDARGRAILPEISDARLSPHAISGSPPTAWYTVAGPRADLPDGYVVVYSVARSGGVERRLECVLRREKSGHEIVVWRELTPSDAGERADAAL
ncbi:MAG: hypothetical protein KF886_12140 [Candidatus Hydrogenedentes bacterium]|nr:hypothetical protein [Candidatus Hydrogenedentota bacterium]